jgi:hypothetical protein
VTTLPDDVTLAGMIRQTTTLRDGPNQRGGLKMERGQTPTQSRCSSTVDVSRNDGVIHLRSSRHGSTLPGVGSGCPGMNRGLPGSSQYCHCHARQHTSSGSSSSQPRTYSMLGCVQSAKAARFNARVSACRWHVWHGGFPFLLFFFFLALVSIPHPDGLSISATHPLRNDPSTR